MEKESKWDRKLNDVLDTTTELNVVNCGDCGKVFAHEMVELEDLTCPYCKYQDDVSSFPDFYFPPRWNDSIVSIKKDEIKVPTKEELMAIHKELHTALDKNLACFISETGKSLQKTTLMDFLQWSSEQTANPACYKQLCVICGAEGAKDRVLTDDIEAQCDECWAKEEEK